MDVYTEWISNQFFGVYPGAVRLNGKIQYEDIICR